MHYKKIIIAVGIIVIVTAVLTIGSGCANIIPPQGGPKDTLPPVLVKAAPENKSKNFNSNRITFSFNEFVDVQNVQENLLVSPIPKINPVVDYKLNTVSVRLKDTLEKNTTYSLNFGKSIKDVNEGNIMKDFTYTFTTGNYFDTLELKGSVILAETGKTDSTLIVMLHTESDDSSVVTKKPRYVTRLDGKGNFTFSNLPPRTFYLYALKDDGGSRRYFSEKQIFAFADSAIKVSTDSKPVTLYAYATSGSSPQQTLSALSGIKKIKKSEGAVDRRLKYQTSLKNNQQDLLTDSLVLIFEEPIRSFDSLKIGLFSDSVFNTVAGYKFRRDSSGQKIILSFTDSKEGWKENTLYHIILDKDFAEDNTGRKLLKTDTLSFTTKKLSDYGTLKLRIRNIELGKHPVLQFIQNDLLVQAFPLTGEDFYQPLFLPGDYQLRILYDDNKNGVWDPGVFFKEHKQPEISVPIERKITIKPSWQNDFDIAL
jgi:hypothetical protein